MVQKFVGNYKYFKYSIENFLGVKEKYFKN